MSAARTYADKQRAGLQEEHLDSSSIDEHIDAALSDPFFLSLDTPLPGSMKEALGFANQAHPAEILSFWEVQLTRMQQLVHDAIPIELKWGHLIPDELRPAAGKRSLAPLMSLMNQRNLGGSAWLFHFIYGFKPTGIFCREHAFPTSDNALKMKPIFLKLIVQSDASRFPERAAKSGYKNYQLLRDEAMKRQRKGWLSQDPTLSSEAAPFTRADHKLKIALKWGAEQADRQRACDDLRYSMTNLACCVATPIKLASWDRLAEMCRAISSNPRDWHIFKDDRESAYKQPPPLSTARAPWRWLPCAHQLTEDSMAS